MKQMISLCQEYKNLFLSVYMIIAAINLEVKAEEISLVSDYDYSSSSFNLTLSDFKISDKYSNLKVGVVDDDFAPVEIVNRNELNGIAADYLSIVTDSLGLSVKIKKYKDHPSAVEALLSGEIDIFCRGSFYEARIKELTLSTPYIANAPIIASRNNVFSKFTPGISGKIAIAEGYIEKNRISSRFPLLEPVAYKTVREALHSVEFSASTWYFGDSLTAAYVISKGELPGVYFRALDNIEAPGFSFVFRKKDFYLKELFDKVLDGIKPSERDKIRYNWVGVGLLNYKKDLGLSASEIKWVEESREFRVATIGDSPPFSFYDGQGNLKGVISDLINEIAQETGLRFKLVKKLNLEEIIEGMKAGEIDATFSLPMSSQYNSFLRSSRNYTSVSSAVVGVSGSNIGVSELSGSRVALVKGEVGSINFQSELAHARVQYYSSYLDALVAVAKGKAEVAVMPLPIAHDMVQQYFNNDLKVLFSLPNVQVLFPVYTSANDITLSKVIDKAIGKLHVNFVGDSVRRWQSVRPSETSVWINYEILINKLLVSGALLLILLLISMFYFLYSRKILATERSVAEYRRALLDGIPVSVAVLDLQERFVYCNKALTLLLGDDRKIEIGSSFSEFSNISPCSLNENKEKNSDTLVSDKDFENVVFLNFEGRSLALQQWSVNQKDSSGKIIGYIVGWIDITQNYSLIEELQVVRDQALDANSAKSRFLAVMSHEIRTPLNAIIGLLELTLRRLDKGDAFDRELLEVAYSSSSSLLLLVGDILDFAKIESGRLTIDPHPCNPFDVIEVVRRVFDGLAKQKNIYLQVEYSSEAPFMVLLDSGRLKQIISNLVSNSIKFTSSGGVKIKCDIQSVGDNANLLFDIIDTGVGISHENQKLLFQPFVQVGERYEQGSGLGLVICKQILDLMGGQMSISSSPGLGTVVHFSLCAPLVESNKIESLAESEFSAQGAQSLKILLVDDHPANRMLLQQQLNFIGHNISEAENGQDALALFSGGDFDAVITDINMPGMSGYDLCRTLRGLEQSINSKPLKIIGFTANAQPEELERCLAAGMNDCLFKPVGLNMLKKCLGDASLSRGASNSIFDLEALRELTGSDDGIVFDLVEKLYSTNSEDLLKLNDLLNSGYCHEIDVLVHRLKGAARMINASEVLAAVSAFEMAVIDSVDNNDIMSKTAGVLLSVVNLQASLSKWMEGFKKL